MSASWQARARRDEDESVPSSSREAAREAPALDGEENDPAPRGNRFWLFDRARTFADARARRVPAWDRAKIERKSVKKLKELRARCVRCLEYQERAMPTERLEAMADVEFGGELDAGVEALARELALGDSEKRRAYETMKVIDEIFTRRRRHEETKYTRLIEAIPRDATRLIDEYNMRRFIHRGIDVERLDEEAFQTLFNRCLQGLGNESLTLERMIPVDHLLRLVRRGTWETLWREYADAAMKKSLAAGCSGISVALYAIADTDPLGPERFGGLPDSSALLDGPKEYLKFLFQLLTLPATAPIFGLFSRSVRRTLHMSRFMFTTSAWRTREASASFVALAVYYTPYWVIGLITIVWYFTSNSTDAVAADGVVPAAIAFTMTSFVAMSLASTDVQSYSKMSAVTLYFPGGKTELPDGDSKLVQEHPTVDTLRVRGVRVAVRAPIESSAKSISARQETVPMHEENASSEHKHSGRGKNGKTGGMPRWMAEMEDFAENIDSKEVQVQRRAKNAHAGMGKNGARGDMHLKDNIEEIVATNKLLQLRTVTEKDVLLALHERTNAESWRTYWLSTKKSTWLQQGIMLILATIISLLPFFIRGALGYSAFGEAKTTVLCVAPTAAATVPEYLGFTTCPATLPLTIDGWMGVITTGVSLMQRASAHYGVILAFVWSILTLFVTFNISRWLCSCAYHDTLHWLLFQSTTDPSLALASDLPFVNLCQSWLPWIRIRMVVEDHRELEQYWCQYYLTHMIVLVAGTVVVSLLKVIRLYLFYDIRSVIEVSPSAPIYPLFVATVLMVPIITMASAAAKTRDIQEHDVVILQEARWKLFLDNSTILNAGMENDKADILSKNKRSIEALKELERIVERRNVDAWPCLFGVRVGAAQMTLLYALAFTTFALTCTAIAIEVFVRTRAGASADSTSSSLRNVLRVGFAYLSAGVNQLKVDHVGASG